MARYERFKLPLALGAFIMHGVRRQFLSFEFLPSCRDEMR